MIFGQSEKFILNVFKRVTGHIQAFSNSPTQWGGLDSDRIYAWFGMTLPSKIIGDGSIWFKSRKHLIQIIATTKLAI